MAGLDIIGVALGAFSAAFTALDGCFKFIEAVQVFRHYRTELDSLKRDLNTEKYIFEGRAKQWRSKVVTLANQASLPQESASSVCP